MALSIKNMCDGIKKDAIAHIRRFDEKQEEDKVVSTFPISCFPSDIQKIVLALRDFLGFPIDYTSAAILVAFSLGIGNQVRIKVKNGWIESATLYCALVGKPGSNKSHPMSFILQPFILHDQRTYEAYISALDEYEALKEMTNKERLAKGIEEMPQMPHWKQMVVSDVTQESLGKVLSHNPHGVCLYSDELASWLKNFERYNKGSEEQFWLSLFNNKLVTTSRKMDKRPINIAHPFASVIGSIQLDILQMLLKGDKGKNGFFDRILFAYPKVLKKNKWQTEDIGQDVVDMWERIAGRLICKYVDGNQTNSEFELLSFSDEAKQHLWMWQEQNTDYCNQASADVLVGISCKMETYIIRFCLILQMMDNICNGDNSMVVNKHIVEKAISLVDYFKDNANRVIRLALWDNLDESQRELYDKLPERFATSEIKQMGKALLGWEEKKVSRFLKSHLDTLFKKVEFGVYRKIL